MRLSSRSFLEGFYYKPRIDKEILAQHSEGLICLSGCASAPSSPTTSCTARRPRPRSSAPGTQKIFGEENFFVEIQNNGVADPARLRGRARSTSPGGWACRWSATSDAHYLTQDDAAAHDVLLCINTGKTRRRPEPDESSRPTSSTSAAPTRCTRRCPATRRPWRPRRGSPSWSSRTTRASASASGSSPRSSPPARRRPKTTSASSARQGLRRALRRAAPAGGPRAARARAGHHQPDGVRLVLPDRLGLRPVRPRERASPLGARLGLRGAGQLPAPAEPRLPAQVRPAVRAVPRPEPLRGARHRHRPLPGAPVRGHRVRPQEVRRRPTSPRSARSARWPPRPPSRTSAGR